MKKGTIMSKLKVIGFSGRAHSGKSTIAREVVKQVGTHAYLMAFATPLKSMLATLMAYGGVDVSELPKEEPSDVLMGHSLRHAMQTLGTEWGRDCLDPSFWCHMAQLRMDVILRDRASMRGAVSTLLKGRKVEAPVFVFDDVRFDTEVRFINLHGGYVIHLNRGTAGIGTQHKSEKGITIPPDLVISNDGATPEEVADLVCKATMLY